MKCIHNPKVGCTIYLCDRCIYSKSCSDCKNFPCLLAFEKPLEQTQEKDAYKLGCFVFKDEEENQ